jgi:hypothetical protein
MKTIYAFGCSVTHGAELVHSYTHEENTPFSYPNLVAQTLGVECKNYAVCGISNEGIFHKVLDTIPKYSDVTTVIVGWTSDLREYWKCDERDWFIIPSWCATTCDGTLPYVKDYTDTDINLYPRVCVDDITYTQPLSDLYELTVKYKFDAVEYNRKKQHYVEMVRLYCKTYNIKLIETTSMAPVDDINIHIDNIGSWRKTLGHPTANDHQIIAKQIIEQYKL